MCTVSNIGDSYKDMFPKRWPGIGEDPDAYRVPYSGTFTWPSPGPTQAEFDALKKEVEELKKLLLAAKKFDEATGQPHCEMDEKVDFIKKLAKFVGVDMNDVFKQG